MWDCHSDKLQEECGIFGILGHNEAAALTALGLHALQHRGQEAAGITTATDQDFYTEKHLGLVSDHYTKAATLAKLIGDKAIGHTRYATTGETALRNVQPLYAELSQGGIAIAHNGNLSNGQLLRQELIASGSICQSTSDTEVVLHLIARSRAQDIVKRFQEALSALEGGYAILALTQNKLIAARDPVGIRPLIMGELNNKPVFCSETCALDIIGAKYVRDIENGEIVVCQQEKNGEITIHAIKPKEKIKEKLCLFEYVYFSRPDSLLAGRNIYETRKQMGIRLAQEAPSPGQIVVPVPASGTPAALGYAQESGQPFELGLIRNHYMGRTFIEPTQQIRSFGVKLKHSANRAVLKDKKITLVDDSIVRGTTAAKLVRLIREAGASEIHMRIACPMIAFPDFYGIDMPNPKDLLANQYKSIKEMSAFLGVDSLHFLSIDGLYQAICGEKRNNSDPQFCDHYFTGHYVIPPTDYHNRNKRDART